MSHPTSPRHAGQVATLQRQFAQAPGLPFADVLQPDAVKQALELENISFRERLFSPLVTLWVFLSQILDPDHSCRQAVARFLAWRVAQKLQPCSADTGAYCKARQRLPEGLLARLVRSTGRQLQDQAPVGWRWRGRTVKVVDGTTVSLPDSPDNRRAFPPAQGGYGGGGFPVVRLVVLFSLAVGTVLDAAWGRFQGKQTGETALFRTLHEHLRDSDVLLADRYYCSYWELALVQQRGADIVCRLHQRRRPDFRRGLRWGRGDHVIRWIKPKRPAWMDEATYAGLPNTLLVRELLVRVRQRGFRTRSLVVATTLLTPQVAPPEELALLYRLRWYAELDLRALKAVMQMGVLRCQTVAMVRKELWAHFLAYNLIRTTMAQAAQHYGLLPLEISFKGALQTVVAFAAVLLQASARALETLCRLVWAALVRHRVGHRPDRYEPRAKRRRPNPNPPPLNEPRQKARARLATKC
jgi:Transposase DDE domain